MNSPGTSPAGSIGGTAAQIQFDNELAGLASEITSFLNNPVRMVGKADSLAMENQGWTQEALNSMYHQGKKMLRAGLSIVNQEQKERWERRRLERENGQNTREVTLRNVLKIRLIRALQHIPSRLSWQDEWQEESEKLFDHNKEDHKLIK